VSLGRRKTICTTISAPYHRTNCRLFFKQTTFHWNHVRDSDVYKHLAKSVVVRGIVYVYGDHSMAVQSLYHRGYQSAQVRKLTGRHVVLPETTKEYFSNAQDLLGLKDQTEYFQCLNASIGLPVFFVSLQSCVASVYHDSQGATYHHRSCAMDLKSRSVTRHQHMSFGKISLC